MTRVLVYHSTYGCDTGCCGHTVALEGTRDEFFFAHPWGDDPRGFAEELVREAYGDEHVADLDWSSCIIEED